MQDCGDIMREFRTENFLVRAIAEDEPDVDLSWDDTGETRKGLESGKYVVFCAHVQVIHIPTGEILGDDYLGNCIYTSFADFMDHRACGRQNRKLKKQKKGGQCGSYFSQMIGEAIAEARKNYKERLPELVAMRLNGETSEEN
jgi:hypothetical protein